MRALGDGIEPLSQEQQNIAHLDSRPTALFDLLPPLIASQSQLGSWIARGFFPRPICRLNSASATKGRPGVHGKPQPLCFSQRTWRTRDVAVNVLEVSFVGSARAPVLPPSVPVHAAACSAS